MLLYTQMDDYSLKGSQVMITDLSTHYL